MNGRIVMLAGAVATVLTVIVAAPAQAATTRGATEQAAGTPPAAPFLESVAGTGLGALATWAPAASQVLGFEATATPAAGSPASCPGRTVAAGATDTQAVVGGLCAGVVYTVTVRARNAAGNSAASNASAPVVPLTAQKPGVPLITSVLSRNRALDLTWAPPDDDGGKALTRYTVTAAAKGKKPVVVTTSASAAGAVVGGLVNGTAYALSLTASNAVGASAASSGTGTPEAVHVPAAPTELTVAPDGKGHLVASWTPPADNGGSPVTGYTVSYRQATLNVGTGQWTPVSGGKIYTIKTTATTATASAFGTSKAFYLFSVTATNHAGTGAAGTQRSAVTPVVTAGSNVTVLSATTVSALSAVSDSALTWKDPAPAQATQLAAGQTIVAAPGGALPDGMLRQVVSVSDSGGTLTVATEQGRLADAFSAMALDTTVNPAVGAAGSGLVHSAARTGPAFTPAIAGVRVVPSDTGGSAGFGGSVTLWVDVKLDHVQVEAEASLTTSIDVSLGVHQGFTGVPDGVSVSAAAKVYNGSGWTYGTPVTGNTVLPLAAISCSSPTLCAAVGPDGNAYVYDGSTWSDTPIDPYSWQAGGTKAIRGNTLLAVSCGTPATCEAIDSDGYTFGYQNGTWTEGSRLPGNGWAGVSCGSATSCVAVGGNAAAVLTGTTWSAPSSIDSATVNAVSCTSPSFCEAVDSQGDAVTFNGASWTAPSPVLPGIPLTTVSCDATGCKAVGVDPATMESEVVSGTIGG